MDLTKYLVTKAGVLVKPGIYFGPDGDAYFRIVYCRDERVIREGVRRIAAALAAKRSR
jgi:aspartate/methionine/tyrosine aminotransferase